MAKSKVLSLSILGIIIFVLGITLGVSTYSSFTDTSDEHSHILNLDEHEEHSHEEHIHNSHDTLEATQPYPSVNIIIHEDPKSGWNVEMVTKNFEFSPTSASKEHVEGEGHAHLYINGEKINRLYNNWYHIAELESGENEIRVTLNANSHEDLTVNGKLVEDVKIITV